MKIRIRVRPDGRAEVVAVVPQGRQYRKVGSVAHVPGEPADSVLFALQSTLAEVAKLRPATSPSVSKGSTE